MPQCVDAILTYGMDPQQGTDSLWVYLYDVPYQRFYTLEGKTWYYKPAAAGALAFLTHTVTAEFTAFRKQHSPREPGMSRP